MPEFNRLEDSIAGKRTRLKFLEGAYLRAQQCVKAKEWGPLRDKALDRVGRLVRTYQGEEAVKAVFVLGQIREIINEADGPMNLIREYESEKASLNQMVKRRG